MRCPLHDRRTSKLRGSERFLDSLRRRMLSRLISRRETERVSRNDAGSPVVKSPQDFDIVLRVRASQASGFSERIGEIVDAVWAGR